jgi:hypothetical protein
VEANQVTVVLDHLSEFALVGGEAAGERVFLPLVLGM